MTARGSTLLLLLWAAGGCAPNAARLVPVAPGWAKTSVNTVIFRRHSITTHGNTQYVSFYDADANMVLAKRTLGSDRWEIRKTPYTGNVRDAHNTISMAVDGAGVLHLSWDHHGHPLRYVQSVAPGSLDLTDKQPMTGRRENRVTYPEFFNLDDGGLLFLYRDGASGNGCTMLNRFDVKRRTWSVVQHPLIDGLGRVNAYTNQIAIDRLGAWHVSWCWRETGDVATNHDLCYAKSPDQGRTWLKSTGEAYALPITPDNAEVIVPTPQNSDLINTGTMAVDSNCRPMIATYWRAQGEEAPQYRLVRFEGGRWSVTAVGRNRADFRLQGGGTRRIRLSRPCLAVGRDDRVYMLFRTHERGGRVSVAIASPAGTDWRFVDLTTNSVGLWEPSFDNVLWERDGVMHVFVQRVEQGDGETGGDLPPQIVSVLEWKP